MIRSNLAIILAENNLKITKVSFDTGISRTTLTALSQNDCKGVQFDTLNTLCRYLHVYPQDLLSYVPIDIDKVKFFPSEPIITRHNNRYIKGTLCFTLLKDSIPLNCSFDATLELKDNTENNDICFFGIQLLKSDDEQTNMVVNYIRQLPRPFFNDISWQIARDTAEDFIDFNKTNADILFVTDWDRLDI